MSKVCLPTYCRLLPKYVDLDMRSLWALKKEKTRIIPDKEVRNKRNIDECSPISLLKMLEKKNTVIAMDLEV